jgi:hypothetical protein
MIKYTLVCRKRHEFESWFANSDAYDKQVKRSLVTCPVCGTTKVEKALMTPRLVRTKKRALPVPKQISEAAAQVSAEAPIEAQVPAAAASTTSTVSGAAERIASVPAPAPVAIMSPQEREFRAKLKELRDHLVSNAENVGPRFPEEARKMHYGEAEHRSIYGIASPEDAKQLHEEGIEFSPLPALPDERN